MQDYSDLEDGQLVTLIADGSEGALEALYERYGRTVFSMARYMLGHTQQAEEVTQEVFINVWLKAKSYDSSRGAPRTWLMSVAHHRVVDEVRSRKRLAKSTDQVPHELLDLHPTTRPTPEGEAQRNLAREDILAAMADLPDEQRCVIAMAYFGGYSQSEIATQLGQPLGTVKTRTRLGMHKLRDALKHYHGGSL